MAVMLISGALAGLAGAVDVLGVHYRLIEGFSTGFGFTAVSIALIGGLSPLGVLPDSSYKTGLAALARFAVEHTI